MNPEHQEEFVNLLIAVSDQYNRPFSESFLNVYWHCLKMFSLTEIQAAFITHFENPDNGRFMPQPSDILRILEGDSESQALQAWTKVMNGIKQVGAYSSIVFDDPLIHAVIGDMCGWVELCKKTQEELKFVSYEFQKRYRGYFLRRPQQYLNRLTGILDHGNTLNHHTTFEPILFGDQKVALITYAEGCDPQQLQSRSMTRLSQALAEVPAAAQFSGRVLKTQPSDFPVDHSTKTTASTENTLPNNGDLLHDA